MKIVGIIAEYNPFHNGHKYHIQKALEITGSDAAVVLMSGNFVQRGTPAIMPKQLRAKAALNNGASLILELPVCFACGSAEYFARGAIEIFNSLGGIDCICFGSENGETSKLEEIARTLFIEPEPYRQALKNKLKTGLSFPAARKAAIEEYTGDSSLAKILDSPNNTLGIEYMKALMVSGSRMKAYTTQRLESDYHDTLLSENYSSASAIRRQFSDTEDILEILARLETNIPLSCKKILEETFLTRYPVYSNDFSLLLKYRLLSETKESLTEYADVTPELANRIINHMNDLITWDQFCETLKTKEVTYTRISRVLLHILLGIRRKDMILYAQNQYAHYARILGFRKKDTQILTQLAKTTTIPLITKLSSGPALTPSGAQMLQTDLHAEALYESVITHKYQTPYIPAPKHPIIII